MYNVTGRIFMLRVYLLYFKLQAYSCRNSSFPWYRVWQIVELKYVLGLVRPSRTQLFFIFCQANLPCPTRPAFLCKTIVRHLEQQRTTCRMELSNLLSCFGDCFSILDLWTTGPLRKKKCVHVWTWPKIFSSNSHHLCLFKADICVVWCVHLIVSSIYVV